MIIRWFGGILLGVAATLALFGFMLKLVTADRTQEMLSEAVTQMRFVDVPDEPPPKPDAESNPAHTPESPQPLASRDLLPVLQAPVKPQPQAVSDVAVPTPMPQDFAPSLPGPQSSWSVPVAGDSFAEGEKGRGYVEVIPIATRRPNIPERAWQHKIDGWVRVAFRLTAEGRTADVRVLDAHPGGVFEETVIRAVEDWLYDMRDIQYKGDLILTQKIELFWRDYPDNSPYLD